MAHPDNQVIVAAMQAYVDNITESNLEGIIDLFAEDAVVEDPIGSDPVRGHEALRVFYQAACDGVGKMVLEGNVRVRDNWGACAMLAYPKGAEDSLTMETLDVMEFNEQGKIVAMTAYWGDGNLRSL
jgi:steroid delta-isomerase